MTRLFRSPNCSKKRKFPGLRNHKDSIILTMRSQCEGDVAWPRSVFHIFGRKKWRLGAFLKRLTNRTLGALKWRHKKKHLKVSHTDCLQSLGTLAYGYKVATVTSGFEDLFEMIKAKDFWKLLPENELLPLLGNEDIPPTRELSYSVATSSLLSSSFKCLSAQIFLLLNVPQKEESTQYQDPSDSKHEINLFQTLSIGPLKTLASLETTTVPQASLSIFLRSLPWTLPTLEDAQLVEYENP